MTVDRYLIEPSAVASARAQPLAIVDLDACPHDASIDTLPMLPVIGIGDPRHPLAGALDAMVEAPVAVERLVDQIEARPHAASVIVQLLRLSEQLPLDPALTLESLAYGLLQGSQEYAEWLAARETVTKEATAGRVIVERRDSELLIVLDRPEARNAIDRHMRDRLFEAFTVVALDPEVRSVKFRAKGPVFSAGGDLAEFGMTRDPATAHEIRCRTLPARAIIRRPDITDVYVQGACIGAGLEMAAFAPRISAASNAWFQLPELAMGLLPGAGGCVSVPRRIGRQRTALMMLSGQRIDAVTALRWRLIDAIEEVDSQSRGRLDDKSGGT